MPNQPKPIPKTIPHRRRRALGAAMIETVLILPFIMVVMVLIIYLGWNFRRVSQVTTMDRYVVWDRVTPGAPGPKKQERDFAMRNPRLNETFYGLNADYATSLNDNTDSYDPIGHTQLRNKLADETFAYFDEFIDNSPRAIGEQFRAQHEHISPALNEWGLSDLTRNGLGHSRMNGDWRYVNGVRYDSGRGEWEAGGYRVTPGNALREVFFFELDDGLDPYVGNGNRLARAIRDFYFSYPGYRGPVVDPGGLDEDNDNNNDDDDDDFG